MLSADDAVTAYNLCGSGPFVGEVKNVGPKYAFFTCDVVQRHFGQEVFVLRTDFPPQGLQANAQVTFSLKVTEKGQPQAENITLIGPLSGSPNVQPLKVTGQSKTPPSFSPVQKITVTPSTPKAGADGGKAVQIPVEIQTGIVKNMSDKGFAFVDCQKIKDQYGRDAFISDEEVAMFELQAGMEIHFILRLNDKGQPVAKIVPLNGKFKGVFKNFNAEKGFGFIDCPEAKNVFGQDVFVHRREVDSANVQVGDSINFLVAVNAKGQPQAVVDKVYNGIVKKRKNLTFIECPEVKQRYGKDAFVIDGNSYTDNDVVSFWLKISKEGNPQAADISVQQAGIPTPISTGRTGSNRELISDGAFFEGVVKSMGEKFGFVDCPAAYTIYNQDVYLPCENTAVEVGDEITFNLQINGKGQPQARNIHKRGLPAMTGSSAKRQRTV